MEGTCDYHLWLSRTEEDYGHYEKWNACMCISYVIVIYCNILPVFMDFHTQINPLISFPIKIIYGIALFWYLSYLESW